MDDTTMREHTDKKDSRKQIGGQDDSEGTEEVEAFGRRWPDPSASDGS